MLITILILILIDPGLIIKIGNQYTFQTDRVQDGGTDVDSFPSSSFKDITVKYEDLEHGLELVVEAHNMDKNNSSKRLLGTGKVTLTDVLKTYDSKHPFAVPLDTKGVVTMSIMIAVAKLKEKSTGYHHYYYYYHHYYYYYYYHYYNHYYYYHYYNHFYYNHYYYNHYHYYYYH